MKWQWIIIAASIAALPHAAIADWSRVDKTANSSMYLWYPVKTKFPYVYPIIATRFKPAIAVPGWEYDAKSNRMKAITDCRTGRTKVTVAYYYTGSAHTGSKIKVKSFTLRNGLKVRVGRWYAYDKFPSTTRKLINLVCF